MHVHNFSSLYLQNDSISFKPTPLPFEAQLFPIFAIQIVDVDIDGFDDMLLVGNSTATQPDFGPDDAGLGLFLKGNGKGEFVALSPDRSGFIVKGEGREIRLLKNSHGEKVFLVSMNNDFVKAFKKMKHD